MYWWAAAHGSDTVYFGQPDAPGQSGGGPVQVPVMYLGILRGGGARLRAGRGGVPARIESTNFAKTKKFAKLFSLFMWGPDVVQALEGKNRGRTSCDAVSLKSFDSSNMYMFKILCTVDQNLRHS